MAAPQPPPAVPVTPRPQALVLSGGGARGAYEIGVLKALFNGQSAATAFRVPDIQIYTGTSVGSYNATFLASRPELLPPQAIAELEGIWRERIAGTPERCGNGVFELNGIPEQLFNPGCWRNPLQNLLSTGQDALFWARYGLVRGTAFATSDAPYSTRLFQTVDVSALFSLEPLRSLLHDTIPLEGLRASGDTLAVLASNWREGTPRQFTGPEIADQIGTDAIMASAAVPGFFQPVDIEGTPYVDGGVLMNTPLRPAIRAGADVIHVIYVDPDVQEIPFPRLPDTMDSIYRLWVIATSAQMNRDILLAAEINREIALLQASGHLDAAGRVSREIHPRLARASRVISRIYSAQSHFRKLTIHRYRPTSTLNGAQGFLDFRIGYIDDLIEIGYEDALHHDCEESECVLPDRPEVQP
jgi:NTE family protein